MKRPCRSLTIGPLVALIAAFGCTPNNSVKSGAPVMVTFSVVDPTGSTVELLTEAGTTTPVPPLSTFYALFDRILDPTPLEELDGDGGITPKEGAANVAWSGGAIPVKSLYVPDGDRKFTLIAAAYGLRDGPSLTVTPTMGLPSGSSVTVALEPSKVRSHDQTTPFVAGDGVMTMLTFETEPLTATVTVPAAPEAPDAGTDDAGTDDAGASGGAPPSVATDYVVNVSFNNLTTDATADVIQVSATLAGAPIAGFDSPPPARDAMKPTDWDISPPQDGWPPGAVVTVTVGAAAADNFQQTLAAPVSATFTVMQ